MPIAIFETTNVISHFTSFGDVRIA